MASAKRYNMSNDLKGKGVSQIDFWENGFPGRKDSQCKGPEAGTAWCVLGTAGTAKAE